MGSGNWIVDNLNSALQTWNDKLAEIWTLISTTPEEFKGGGIWNVIVSINGALQAIGYALLVLFFRDGRSQDLRQFLPRSSARRWPSSALSALCWPRRQ